MRSLIAPSLVSLATYLLSGALGAQMPDPRPGPSTPVTIVNMAPVPVTVPGGIAVSGSVSVANTPSVNVANTPSVNVANTPAVTISNSPTVQSTQSGAWSVGITGPVSLAAGANVAAVPTVPQQPYVFHSPDGAAMFVFRTANPTIRLALTSVIIANQDSVPQFVRIFADSCGGAAVVEYLKPLIPAVTTFVATFPTPLVIGAAPNVGGFCLNVETPNTGALFPYTLVGYVLND